MRVYYLSFSLVCIFFFTMFVSCKNGNETANKLRSTYDGKKILTIKSNVIELEGGENIILQEDSIDKVFYLVRHAEKDTSDIQDPPLSEDGYKRATKIADIMRGTRVDAIYSTLTLRALYTVDSLADIKAMSVLPVDNRTLSSTLNRIKTSKDYNRIFMVGHSNTIPSITNSLANRDEYKAIFDDSDYGNFIIVVAKKSGKSDVYKLKY